MRIFARVMVDRPGGGVCFETHRATIRNRGLGGWLAYQVGWWGFLWRSRRRRIVFREDELEDLAERLGTRS